VIRVLVADDQALLRGSFSLLVGATGGMEVAGEAATGTEAVRLARQERPGVVLMDVRMPGMDGIEATARICGAPETAGVRVLILTMFDLDRYVFGALRAGASGFLLKDTPPEDLLAAIRVVARGEALLAPSVTRRLIATFARRPWLAGEPGQLGDGRPGAGSGRGPREAGPAPGAHRVGLLTGREREVLTLIALGLSNAEIMQRLQVSAATVKTHISHLLAKLGARDRAQLVIIAYETGLVVPAHG
jgi:DNA-binding NarL/FixJ family response regulator